MEQGQEIEFECDGITIKAKDGHTIAEALLLNGVKKFRTTRNDSPRGLYCNMGVCYECRMIVNGIPNTRTCMTLATSGCKVETQKDVDIQTKNEDV